MIKIDLNLTFLASAYAFMMGIAYLWGYWEVFDVGITTVISFMSPTDIFKAASIPLFISITTVLLFIQCIDPDTFSKDSFEYVINQKGGKFKALKSVIVTALLVTVLVSSSFIYELIKFNKQIYFSAVMAWVWAYIIFIFMLTSTSLIPKVNHLQRSIILWAIVYLIFGAYTTGVNNGVKLTDGHGNVSVLTDKPCGYFENPIFIANYDGRIFLYSHFNNAICITSADTIRLKSEKETQ